MLAFERFREGCRTLEHLPQKKAENVASPTQGATHQSVGVPNPNSRGHTTKRGLRDPNPNSRGHATKHGKEKQERKKEHNTAPTLERIRHCTWDGVLLPMQDLHFATNDICIAPLLANMALKSTDGLMQRKHPLKPGGTVGAMRKKGDAIPKTHCLSKPRGGGGGGWGLSHTRTGPGRPPGVDS